MWEDIEPAISWNLNAGRADFFAADEEQDAVPVLLQLDGVTARDLASGAGFRNDADRRLFLSLVEIPPFYTDVLPALNEAFENNEYITALVREALFKADRKEEERLAPFAKGIREVAISPPLPRDRYGEPMEFKQLPKLAKRRKGRVPKNVVVGIIDDGIALAHERFRKSSLKTRIEYAWVQDLLPVSGPFGYGHEFDKAAIDTLLSTCEHNGVVDEDEFYRLSGLADFARPKHKPVAWRRAHGTVVLDLASGARPGAAPHWPIVCVQLPVAAVGLRATATLARYVIDGLWYTLYRSLFVKGAPLPVVINLSYGFTDGPHDGTQIIERAIDCITALWTGAFGVEVSVVIAAGNSYLDRLHARPVFQKPGGSIEIPWRVQPGDRAPNVVEIWLPDGPPSTSRLNVSAVAPVGGGTKALGETPGQSELWPPGSINATALCEVIYAVSPAGRGRFRITIQPTARVDPGGGVAPSGLWTICLDNLGLPKGAVVDAYVALNEAPYGYPPRGRQSYFDDPAYERYDNAGRRVQVDNASIVKREGSLNALGTGHVPSVIGGVRRKELTPADYSAGGPIPVTYRYGPDALAVSDDSKVDAGVLAAGTRSGSVVAMNGTSVAAPMVTRWIASELAAGRPADRFAVQRFAALREPLPPPAPAPWPPERGGAGRILLPPLHGPRP